MKMDKLLALYPQAQKKNSPASEADILSFAIDDASIWIKQDTHGITIFLKMLLVFKKKAFV